MDWPDCGILSFFWLDKDRANAICKFCDTYFVGTNFVGGGKYKTSVELVEKINDIWGAGQKDRFVVLTGGEPLLQVDEPLIDELHRHGYMVHLILSITTSSRYGGRILAKMSVTP